MRAPVPGNAKSASGNVLCWLLTNWARIAPHQAVANEPVSGDDVCALAAAMHVVNEGGYLGENAGECWMGERSEDRLMRGTPWEETVYRASPLLARRTQPAEGAGYHQAAPLDVPRVRLILSFGAGARGRRRWLVLGPLRPRGRKPQRYTFSSFQFVDQYWERLVKWSVDLVEKKMDLAYPSAAVRITGLGTFLSATGVSVEGLE